MAPERFSARLLADQITNVTDFLLEADLALYCNPLSMTDRRIAWHATDPAAAFLDGHGHATIDDYRRWVTDGQYTCVLFDGSLLQISYEISERRVCYHRLAYIPCPWDFDQSLLTEGLPLDEIIDMYRSTDAISMRSPVRFDFDPRAGRIGHPIAHLTFNSVDCRIACVAPVHVHRFVAFVFQHFYAALWDAHPGFFKSAPYQHLGEPIILPTEVDDMHISWNSRLRRTA
ncbi:hypothetical protein Acy02nite_47130 [Actinoplanes cyaneus]|uniref:DUF2290 domain-containing protein n=1 Tax=Actinoplanes cyaneus TaxID=52696 RepID=A0A919M5M8_9ACTN|nr:DUF2290 domain-containing protein [Actinoplanes cyaneus]MCW2138832.1 hypothetical protein [Actinoplanes cyaneus]GID66832.1 hypothetical protein Acy02nite_47130 [Actinoplanes cyaneus]